MPLRGAERANPAVFEDLEPQRVHIRRICAPLLWSLIESTRAHDLDEFGRAIACDLLERVADEALWALTEIQPLDELKYFSQRFISEAVRTRWARLSAENVKHKYLYYRGSDRRVDITHEHVVPRDHLKRAIALAASPEAVRRTLERAVACVVSCEEDRLLPKHGTGWERYLKGGVRVFDRLTQTWADLDALAAAQAQEPSA